MQMRASSFAFVFGSAHAVSWLTARRTSWFSVVWQTTTNTTPENIPRPVVCHHVRSSAKQWPTAQKFYEYLFLYILLHAIFKWCFYGDIKDWSVNRGVPINLLGDRWSALSAVFGWSVICKIVFGDALIYRSICRSAS